MTFQRWRAFTRSNPLKNTFDKCAMLTKVKINFIHEDIATKIIFCNAFVTRQSPLKSGKNNFRDKNFSFEVPPFDFLHFRNCGANKGIVILSRRNA